MSKAQTPAVGSQDGSGAAGVWECMLCSATSLGTHVERARADRSLCSWCADSLAHTSRRRCRKCNKTVPIISMGTAHHGRWCKACDKEYSSARYEHNRAAALERQRAYNQRNAALIREKERVYREKNRDLVNARRRAARRASPEISRARSRAWYWTNRERAMMRAALWRQANDTRLYRARRKLAILWGTR